jgi:hypothetical protein
LLGDVVTPPSSGPIGVKIKTFFDVALTFDDVAALVDAEELGTEIPMMSCAEAEIPGQ